MIEQPPAPCSTSFLVETFDGGDEAALVDLWVASWRETMPAIDFDARRPFIVGVLRASRHLTLVARDAGAPVGFVTVEGCHIHQLVAAPSAKGRGMATTLLDAAKRLADTLTLDVNQANTRAVRFYEREGFVRTGCGINAGSGLATFAMLWQGSGG